MTPLRPLWYNQHSRTTTNTIIIIINNSIIFARKGNGSNAGQKVVGAVNGYSTPVVLASCLVGQQRTGSITNNSKANHYCNQRHRNGTGCCKCEVLNITYLGIGQETERRCPYCFPNAPTSTSSFIILSGGLISRRTCNESSPI